MGAGGMGDMAVYKNTTTVADDEEPIFNDDYGELELIPSSKSRLSKSSQRRRKACFIIIVVLLIAVCVGLVILTVMFRKLQLEVEQNKYSAAKPQALTSMSNSFQKLGNDIEIQHNQTISNIELQLLQVSSNNLNLIREYNATLQAALTHFESDSAGLKSNMSKLYENLEESINSKAQQLRFQLSNEIQQARSGLAADIQAHSQSISGLNNSIDALKSQLQRLEEKTDQLEEQIPNMISDAVSNISFTTPHPLQGACNYPYLEIGGDNTKCVWISNTMKTWSDAKKQCEDNGSYLITFNSKAASNAFGEFLKLPGQPANYQSLMWIGANKLTGIWRWYGMLTGTVPADELTPGSDWHSGHLDDTGYDCMYYHPSSEGWNAHRYCSTSLNFVCEKP